MVLHQKEMEDGILYASSSTGTGRSVTTHVNLYFLATNISYTVTSRIRSFTLREVPRGSLELGNNPVRVENIVIMQKIRVKTHARSLLLSRNGSTKEQMERMY